MVDELNDETERKMDELENRTRALAARVETLTAERNTARASADRWHGVAHRMEEERDAAVKAKEEAERRIHDYMSADNRVAASLRAHVDCGQDGVCAVAPGCNRHWEERNRELAAQLEQVRGLLDRVLTAWKREAQAGDGILEEHVRLFNDACAALSPSPASGLARFFGVPAEALVPHEGPVTYEPKSTLPDVIEAELTPKARLTIERMDGSAETLEFRFFKLLTGAERRRVLIDLGAIPDCEDPFYHSTERLFLRGLIQQGKAKEIAARLPTPAPGKDGGR